MTGKEWAEKPAIMRACPNCGTESEPERLTNCYRCRICSFRIYDDGTQENSGDRYCPCCKRQY